MIKRKFHIIKYLLCFALATVALCTTFAIGAGAERQEENSIYGYYTVLENFDFEDADYSDVNSLLNGYSAPQVSPVLSASGCLYDLVYYEGDWCIRVIPMVLPVGPSAEYSITFKFEPITLSSIYAASTVLFEMVGNDIPGQNQAYKNYNARITFDSVGEDGVTYTTNVSQIFYGSGVNYLDYTPSMNSTEYVPITFDTVTLTFTHTIVGQVIYIKGFGFGALSNNRARPSLKFNKTFDNTIVPVVHEIRRYLSGDGETYDMQYVWYKKDIDFSSFNINMINLVSEIEALYNDVEHTLYGDMTTKLYVEPFASRGPVGYALWAGNTDNVRYWQEISSTSYSSFSATTLYGDAYYDVLYSSVPYSNTFSDAFSDIDNVTYMGIENDSLVDYINIELDLTKLDEYNRSLVLYQVDYLSSFYSLVKKDGYTNGYNSGLSYGEKVGYDKGYSNGLTLGEQTGYDRGYDFGYANGEAVGLRDGDAAGYERGHAEGIEEGYHNGYVDGSTNGREIGYTSGYAAGYDEAEGYYLQQIAQNQSNYSRGFAQGEKVGYKKGYADGHNVGFGEGQNYNGTDMVDLVFGTTSAISTMVSSMFNFNIFGVNLLALLGSFVFVAFIVAICKIFI